MPTCVFNSAFAFGEPHFQTLDRSNFTFNGIGEYLLINTNTSVRLDVQARLEMLSSNATGSVISNIVVKLGDIPAVQVEAGSEQLNIYIGGTLYELEAGDSPLILNSSGILSSNLSGGISDIGDPMVLATSDEMMVVRMEGANRVVIGIGEGASIIASLQTNFLALIVALPESFMNKTSGLLGVFNGHPNDDFRNRIGTILDITSEREIYEQFGLSCKCI